MNRKISLGVAIALMAIVATVTMVITISFSMMDFNNRMQNLREREQTYEKIAEIDRLVRQNFYGEIDDDYLMDSIARGYVSGLNDRYAMYMTDDEYNQTMQDYDGKTADIGVSVVTDPSGYIKIIEVYPDSSAYTAGILEGDLIVKVEDTDVNLENIELMKTALKGEAGTKINLVIRRDNDDTPMEITRRQVEVPMIVSKVYGDVGYIQIKEFNNNTPDQFNRAMNNLLSDGVQALVFDVRNNPGGTIPSVTQILDVLLPEGDIVSATYRDGTTEVLAVSDGSYVNLPMVVLINGRSASASELFAQAIKDYNMGRTVGTTSYGKGVMQTIYSLGDGSALDITTAHFNPPSGENFDGVGVKADYYVEMTPEQERIYYELDEYSDPQLKKALEVANAAIRTGGFEGAPTDEDNTSSSSEAALPEDGDEDQEEPTDEQDSSSGSGDDEEEGDADGDSEADDNQDEDDAA